MHGLIGKFIAKEGEGAALAAILSENAGGMMPGCRSYIVAQDATEPDHIWVTEVWDSAEAHRASLGLPSVQDAIARARPIIAGMERLAETAPVGGI
ncbi:putative quinol monooxygenase [Maritimibacter sp. DP1N21-5]|uniref:putative quinol monooxygenase n=1 Tax=Maritimibacter sp. DP1N21-5 TaxID=2836867 RepID=UPI001C46D24A|nr:putative quinol monooxygenase [Maritimibacter sp. DP1N21-5]MBV7408332.1 antibiotic biosynthesis monooxygenase [Maritimibacter sp. DP1N21-5]